jgi:hypothetical protein
MLHYTRDQEIAKLIARVEEEQQRIDEAEEAKRGDRRFIQGMINGGLAGVVVWVIVALAVAKLLGWFAR